MPGEYIVIAEYFLLSGRSWTGGPDAQAQSYLGTNLLISKHTLEQAVRAVHAPFSKLRTQILLCLWCN